MVALINSPSGASHSSATTVCTVATMEKGAGAKVKKYFFDYCICDYRVRRVVVNLG